MATIEQHILRDELEADPLLFMRYFFKQRMGTSMIVSPHHEAIMRTLLRVFNGEITRLIINISPGYSKTELCTINMMAYGLAINPRAKFLHLSYSHSLAGQQKQPRHNGGAHRVLDGFVVGLRR